MEDLIGGYRAVKQVLRIMRTFSADRAERSIISGMISDCDFVLVWLQTGRQPGNRRGIERRAAYQREYSVDPVRLQMYIESRPSEQEQVHHVQETHRLEEVLQELSGLERTCFEMACGQCMTHAEIAECLGLSRGNVSTLLQRARKKIAGKVSGLYR